MRDNLLEQNAIIATLFVSTRPERFINHITDGWEKSLSNTPKMLRSPAEVFVPLPAIIVLLYWCYNTIK